MDTISILGWLLLIVVLVFLLSTGFRKVHQTQRGLIERFGKYKKYAEPGLHWIIPVIYMMRKVNITEMMVNAEPQVIITKDKLNAQVDAQVYFKVKLDEESVKASQYNVFDYKYQIVNLARTTLRNIIGTLTLNEANSDRNRINKELMETLRIETKNWGIEVVRTELKEIDPPKDVQETMNKVVKAENEKQAAIDFATAAETQADGLRRAAIKNAEGIRQATILEAEGQAQAIVKVAEADAKKIEMINIAIQKFFKNEAQMYKKLETVQASLEKNTKFVIDPNTEITNVIAESMAGVVPIVTKSKEEKQ
ncbi:MAG: SPFH/Band 7/PHB domain protein [Candidatus Thermoplasmatota archaeon]|nr:SPFH/Band 7/PHB domain protein [Candidatus Thermoplasmatota archaeon]